MKKNPNIVVFSSHHIRFPFPHDPTLYFIPIVFIRHPIDRAFSQYNFNKNTNNEDIFSKKAKSMNAADFILWNLETKKPIMRDTQFKFLNDKSLNSPQKEFASVIHGLETCPILGVVDRFDESMVIAEEYLKKIFQNIDLSYVKQNVSPDRKNDLKERIESGRNEIGDKVMGLLIENNKKDFKIYSKANEELDLRKKQIEDFERKLSNFKLRCEKLTMQKKISFLKGKRLIFSPHKKILFEK